MAINQFFENLVECFKTIEKWKKLIITYAMKEEYYDILLTQSLSVTTFSFSTMEFDRAYKALSNGTFVE